MNILLRRIMGSLVVALAAVGPAIAWHPAALAAGPPLASEVIATPQPSGSIVPATVAVLREPVEIQCGAVRNSSGGNLLDSKRAAVCVPPGGACRPRQAREARVARSKRMVLALAAEEARNRDAALALQAYWSLSEAEHSVPELESAIAAIEAAVDDWDTLSGRGLDLPLEDTPLRSRQLALADTRVEVTAAIDSLSLVVCQLAGLPPGQMRTVHPAAGRGTVEAPGDVDALVAEGLARRAELRMLRTMLADLDEDTVEVGTLVLALANPALGADGPGARRGRWLAGRLRHHSRCDSDVVGVRRQLQRLLHDREATVATEVRQAAGRAAAAAERVMLAERQQAVAERAAADVRARQRVGEKDAFSVHLADVEAAAARRGLIERLAGWGRARVELWQAQGVLPAACGCR